MADWRAFVQVSSSLTIDPVITDARELKMINEIRAWKTTDRLLNQCLFPTVLPNHVIKLLHTIQCYLLLWARLYNFSFAWNSLLFSVNWVFISFAHYPLNCWYFCISISNLLHMCPSTWVQIYIWLYLFWMATQLSQHYIKNSPSVSNTVFFFSFGHAP